MTTENQYRLRVENPFVDPGGRLHAWLAVFSGNTLIKRLEAANLRNPVAKKTLEPWLRQWFEDAGEVLDRAIREAEESAAYSAAAESTDPFRCAHCNFSLQSATKLNAPGTFLICAECHCHYTLGAEFVSWGGDCRWKRP